MTIVDKIDEAVVEKLAAEIKAGKATPVGELINIKVWLTPEKISKLRWIVHPIHLERAESKLPTDGGE